MKGSRNSCVALIMMGVEYVSGSTGSLFELGPG